MHIEVTGHGPDLVLIHGWALQGGVFAPLVQRLADRFTLHLVDLLFQRIGQLRATVYVD